MTTTPNMSLELPTNGADIGTWGTKLNVLLPLVDSHNHTGGQGVPITTAALDIDADLSMGGFALGHIKYLEFDAIVPLSTGSKDIFVSSVDNELYWRNNGGTNVKLTSGNALNVAAFVGGIGGDYTAVSAAVAYDDATGAYTFKRGTGVGSTWARLRAGDLRLSEYNTTETVYTAIKAAPTLASSYDITLPTALPGSQTMMQITAAGQVVFSNALAVNQSIVVSGTGRYKHDTIVETRSPGEGVITTGGTFSSSAPSNFPYYQAGASSTIFIPVKMRVGERLQYIEVFVLNIVGVMTWGIYQAGGSIGHTQSTPSANTLRFTVNTPATISQAGPDGYYWLKLLTAGGASVDVYSISRGFDHP